MLKLIIYLYIYNRATYKVAYEVSNRKVQKSLQVIGVFPLLAGRALVALQKATLHFSISK